MEFVRSMSTTLKQVILGIKMVIFAALGWFFLYQIFYSDINILFLILTVLALISWSVAISLGALLMEKKFLYLFFSLSLVSFLVFFNGADLGPGQLRQALYYLVVMLLIFVAFVVYRHKVKTEESYRIKLSFWRILKRGLPLVLTVSCLLIALAYYFSPALWQSSNGGLTIPKDTFNLIISPFKDLISSRMPEESGDQNIEDSLYNFVNTKISNSPVIVKAVPIVLAISLFFLLRLSLIILIPIILILSCLIIKLLLATGFSNISKEKVESETISIAPSKLEQQ